jgi:hypothetical protein
LNYSHKHKFVWHAPAKVASRATADFFREHSDINPHLPHPNNPRMVFTHENMWPEECPRDYLHIVNVRHPYYRWISYWKHDRIDTTELTPNTTDPLDALEKFSLERCDALSEWRIITQFEERIDYIIHAESVIEDLRKLPFISDDLEYEFSTRSKRPTHIPRGTNWDEVELRELVYDRFRQDYDNLGYGKWDNYDHLWDCSPNI